MANYRREKVVKRMRTSAVLALALLLMWVPAHDKVSAQWPTTCIELNDLVEYHLGNADNVGIYQETFDEQAEGACRNDHRNDVLYAFNWVLGGATPATPNMHIAYHSVFGVAVARGAPDYAAGAIAAEVVMNGSPSAYLHGTHAGIPYGEYNCHLQSEQCPLASPHRFVISGKWERLSYEGTCSPFGAVITIRNNTPDWIRFAWIFNNFLDTAGFVHERVEFFDIHVPPETERTLSDSVSVCGSSRDRIQGAKIHYEED